MSSIDYPTIVGRAMRSVVRESLKFFADNSHTECHLIVTFQTFVSGVVLPKYLKEKFPEKITVVLQHKFRDLIVGESDFEVKLSFDGNEESIVVPFNSMTAFADKYANFAVEFSEENKKDCDSRDGEICDEDDKVIHIEDFL